MLRYDLITGMVSVHAVGYILRYHIRVMGIQNIGVIQINNMIIVFLRQRDDHVHKLLLGQKVIPFAHQIVLQHVGQRRGKKDFRGRIFFFQSLHQFIQITAEGAVGPLLQIAELLVRRAEPVIGAAHNNDDVRIFRNLLIAVHISVRPVSADGRTADSQVVDFLCAEQRLHSGRIGILFIAFLLFQIGSRRNAVAQTGDLHLGKVFLILCNPLPVGLIDFQRLLQRRTQQPARRKRHHLLLLIDLPPLIENTAVRHRTVVIIDLSVAGNRTAHIRQAAQIRTQVTGDRPIAGYGVIPGNCSVTGDRNAGKQTTARQDTVARHRAITGYHAISGYRTVAGYRIAARHHIIGRHRTGNLRLTVLYLRDKTLQLLLVLRQLQYFLPHLGYTVLRLFIPCHHLCQLQLFLFSGQLSVRIIHIIGF